MIIFILVDDPNSWIMKSAERIKYVLTGRGHNLFMVHNQEEIKECDVLFILGCTSIVRKQILARSRYPGVVVHPSDLPKGRGFSPLAWQILEGKNEIPVCLFEATENVDEGDILFRSLIKLDGTELNYEIKQKQGKVTRELCLEYIDNIKHISARRQSGKASYYKKRSASSSQLDVNKSILEQFNLLRVVDNNKYPAFFLIKGIKYVITIQKDA